MEDERDSGDQVALIMAESGAAIGRAMLKTLSCQLARLLRDRGLARGDRVAILLENAPAWVVAMWGVRRAEMLFVPVNWHLKPGEIRYVIKDSDARAIVTSAALLETARAAIDGLSLDVKLSVGGGAGFEDFDAALLRYPDTPIADEADGGSMPYSSGTTGLPKGILRALSGDRFATPNGLEAMLRDTYGLDRATVYLSPAPFYHSSPVGWNSAVLVAGGGIVAMERFDAEGALAAIERHHVTHAQFVPTHFVRMLRLPEAVRARYDLSSLRCVVHAAAPCPPDVKRAMIDWLGPIVFEYYAGSERCGFTAIDTPEWLAHTGSIGRSRTSAIHIVDLDTGAELPVGETGLVYFEKPVPFAYHKDTAKTAGVFSPEGWGTHGDVGRLDAEGYLYLADRRSDLILSGGVNIYPQEIENVLTAHPDVADAAVIGIANAEFGQEVKAVVECLPGTNPTAAELIAWCRDSLAGFKVPRSIDFIDTLPRMPNGKLLRRELIDRYG